MKHLFILLLASLPTHLFADENKGWLTPDGSLSPNTNERKSIEGFAGMLVVTADKNWEQQWNTAEENTPFFSSVTEVTTGDEIAVLPFFSNPRLASDKSFVIYCDLSVQKPDGSYAINEHRVLCANGVMNTDPSHIYLLSTYVKFIAESSDPFGEWRIFVNLTDELRHVTVPLQSSFTYIEHKTAQQ